VDNIPGAEVVPLGWCVEAKYRAFERVRETGWDDPVGAYASVAETLFWVDVVDEQLKCKYRSHYESTNQNINMALYQDRCLPLTVSS